MKKNKFAKSCFYSNPFELNTCNKLLFSNLGLLNKTICFLKSHFLYISILFFNFYFESNLAHAIFWGGVFLK